MNPEKPDQNTATYEEVLVADEKKRVQATMLDALREERLSWESAIAASREARVASELLAENQRLKAEHTRLANESLRLSIGDLQATIATMRKP